MLYGAIVTVKILDTHHRRSPLVQGGLEIPIEVTITMEYSDKNQAAISKYKELVGKHYKEPVDGKFEDITATVLQELEQDSSSDDDD